MFYCSRGFYWLAEDDLFDFIRFASTLAEDFSSFTSLGFMLDGSFPYNFFLKS